MDKLEWQRIKDSIPPAPQVASRTSVIPREDATGFPTKAIGHGTANESAPAGIGDLESIFHRPEYSLFQPGQLVRLTDEARKLEAFALRGFNSRTRARVVSCIGAHIKLAILDRDIVETWLHKFWELA